MPELLIGCGSRREKAISLHGDDREWSDLITLDNNADHKPDLVWNLNDIPLPFNDESFDSIHAYEVIEHLGNGPGDYLAWFREWSEWWRLLKPNGHFCGTSPAITSRWLWGDPSHRRVVCKEAMSFLHQPCYTREVGVTAMSDFRYLYKADFDFILLEEKDDSFYFVLRAVKPSRITI